MKVKDILAECLVKMGEENFVSNERYDDQQTALFDRLLSVLNCVYREIVARYLPLTTDEEVTLEKGALSYKNLQKCILYPKKLYFEGEPRKFHGYPDRLESNFSGKATLRYAYLPIAELKAEDEVELAGLTAEAFSDGILAQFYLSQKMFDLAASFDSDFRGKMSLAGSKGRSVVLPERRWQA